ncbi:MAG TPA: RNA polymerase subunit sigma-70 [Planctomycetaceae bacterium]|nr:RNA polymerase subunit sigma-70 [Planctomycetaceae bacterium]
MVSAVSVPPKRSAEEKIASARKRVSVAQTASRTSGPVRTFRRKALEQSFVKFCQYQPEAEESSLSAAEFEALRSQAMQYIESEDFRSPRAETEILGDDFLSDCAPLPGETKSRSARKLSLPPHLVGMCEDKLLTPEQERQLFQRMNFLRYLAAKILDRRTPETTTQWDVERVRGLWRAAQWHRDRIVRANTRLVISIVKKFVNQQCGFDDLLSDGIMALIRSVDKFDYKLGFRFSTYATQVVRRNSYRFVMDRQDERLKVANSISDNGLDVPEDQDPSTMSEYRWNALRNHLGILLNQLDKREKLIVRARFSLGGHRKVQTLQALADRLGISKERVRQLEKRAMEKLQMMAVQNPPDLAEAE